MSTLQEIEAAIECLPEPQIAELAQWLVRRNRQTAYLPVDAWLHRARGAATAGVTTDAVLALTRGEE